MGTLVQRLIDGLHANACVAHRAATAGVAAVVVNRVRERAAGGTVAVAPADPIVAQFGLTTALRDAGLQLLEPEDPDWEHALPFAAVGVTGAMLAVTEPAAALAIACGPGMPRATSLLPPVHVCVVRGSDVVATFADGIDHLGPLARAREIPSAVTWIGGPSRTGDLEMVQTLGVHGPITVEAVVVEDA
jgi:L-lactate dehydrogenase complex protein LldG